MAPRPQHLRPLLRGVTRTPLQPPAQPPTARAQIALLIGYWAWTAVRQLDCRCTPRIQPPLDWSLMQMQPCGALVRATLAHTHLLQLL